MGINIFVMGFWGKGRVLECMLLQFFEGEKPKIQQNKVYVVLIAALKCMVALGGTIAVLKCCSTSCDLRKKKSE